MKPIAKCILIVGAMGILSSCSPPAIDIFVESDAGHLHLTFSQDWGFVFSDKQTPCVDEIGLYEPNTYQRDSAVWLIEAKGEVQCLDLAGVRVGEVPKGWQLVVPLSAMRGQTYTARVQGIGWGETEVRF